MPTLFHIYKFQCIANASLTGKAVQGSRAHAYLQRKVNTTNKHKHQEANGGRGGAIKKAEKIKGNLICQLADGTPPLLCDISLSLLPHPQHNGMGHPVVSTQ